jgi:hypothetical protein
MVNCFGISGRVSCELTFFKPVNACLLAGGLVVIAIHVLLTRRALALTDAPVRVEND